jgi:hypothetical protein
MQENQGINWIRENYQILIVYLFLQIPLVLFDLNYISSPLVSFLSFGNFVLSMFICFVLWQIFLSAFLVIIIVIRMQLEKKIDKIKEYVEEINEVKY